MLNWYTWMTLVAANGQWKAIPSETIWIAPPRECPLLVCPGSVWEAGATANNWYQAGPLCLSLIHSHTSRAGFRGPGHKAGEHLRQDVSPLQGPRQGRLDAESPPAARCFEDSRTTFKLCPPPRPTTSAGSPLDPRPINITLCHFVSASHQFQSSLTSPNASLVPIRDESPNAHSQSH